MLGALSLAALADLVRERVFQTHDVTLATVAFVRPGALPRTTSGKLMRYRCQRDFMNGNIDVLRRFDVPGLALDLSGRVL